MRRRGLCVLTLCLLATCAWSQDLTLYEAGRRALEQHPDQQVAAGRTQAAEAQAGLAQAPYYPSFFGLLSYQQSEQDLAYGIPTQRPNTDQLAALRGSQLLLDFGKRSYRSLSAESRLQASRDQQQATLQQRLASTGGAYYRLARALHILDIEANNLRLSRAKVEDARRLFGKGSQRPDLSIFELDVSLANRNYLEALNAETLARIDLGAAMGDHNPYLGKLDSSFLLQPGWALEAAMDLARNQRPEVKAAARVVESARADVEAAQAEYLPNLSVGANYSFYNKQMPLYLNAWRVGVDLTFPILNEPFLSESVALADAQQQTAEAQLKLLELQVDQEVESSDVNARMALKRVRQAELASMRALRSFVDIWSLYRSGSGTGREVSNAQRDLIEAQRNAVDTEFQVRISTLELYRSAGQLDLQVLKDTQDVRVFRRSLVRPGRLPLQKSPAP